MAANDKPKVNFSFAELDNEVAAPEPFVYTTKTSKRVTWPDIFDMEADKGEEFLAALENKTDGQIIKDWLTEADQKKLAEDKLTLRSRQALLQKVLHYYRGTAGDSGEGNGSES